ncbi:uncharacterized protein LOC132733801 [Ruditapes philippinarum]|uniref:uncharacterized protein LOC132733801 n=1 Tax=Ruditapes philippinarum TaxID=129788 RepID=UPI00295B65F1|nr:uncharacterized protein LOC132733801 [Ruditapes philippinarum]
MVIYGAFVLALFCGVSSGAVAKCKTSGECGTGQCCYIEPEFLVASKRQAVLPVLHQHHDAGICENYRLQGDLCYPLETANGHCGCGSGLSCQWVPEPTTISAKRGMIYHPGPGNYRCATRQ